MELAADLTPADLRDVLAELGERVSPISMARDRLLPVDPVLEPLFVEGGLVRGRVVSCAGPAATTLALSAVRAALVEGAWMVLVGVPTFGADAANELGIPLERVVRVDTDAGEVDADRTTSSTDAVGGGDSAETIARWVDVMGAAIDGFDVVVATVPAELRGDRSPAAVRKLLARLQQRGATVVLLGATGVVPVDLTLRTTAIRWDGLGRGHGHLRRRALDVSSSGRRAPGGRSVSIDLAPAGRRVDLALSVAPDREWSVVVA